MMNEQKTMPWNKEAINQLKSIEEIDERVSILANLESDNYKVIRETFFKLFPFDLIPVLFFNKQTLKNIKFYRARPFNKCSEIANPNTFSCPIWNEDKGRGRANWKGRNVFYASDTPYTALTETKNEYKEGNEFYIAKWGVDFNKIENEKLQVSTLVFDNIHPKNPWNVVFGEDYKKKSENLFKEDGEEETKKYIHLIKKISNLFVELDETKYPITAFIADHRIYSDFHKNDLSQIHFPILIYPSIERERKNCNFAIHPFFVKQYMRIETVFHIKLDEINSKHTSSVIKKIGVCSNKDTLKWYTPHLDISKALYAIESLNCYSCGKKIDLNDIDKIIFKKNNHEITHGEIIANFLKERNYSDFYNLSNIIEENGIVRGVDVEFSSLPLKDITATINDEEHTNLTMDINVKQPIEYNYATF